MNPSTDSSLIRCVFFIAMAPAIGLGIARFGYALLLPEMRSELSWSYSQAGWMNTVNAAGYLVGALAIGLLVKRISLWSLLQTGVVVSVIAVLLTGTTGNFIGLSVLRFVAGLSGALCFVAGGTLAVEMAAASADRGGLILSVFYAGPGVGIVLSGGTVPLYIDHFGSGYWRAAWLLIGVLAVVLAIIFFRGNKFQVLPSNQTQSGLPEFKLIPNISVLAGYFAFGAGYIGYMTFMFAFLKQSGSSATQLSLFWITIGGASMLSPTVWGKTITKFRGGSAISLLTFITLIGAAIPLLNTSIWMLFASGAIFGVAFFSVPAATTVFAKRNANASQWAFVIGIFTVAFGAGQVVGPLISGIVSDNSGELFDGLLWGCFFLSLGAIIPLLQRDVSTEE